MITGYITWNVDPVLFRLGPVVIRWYSVFLLISFYLSYRFTVHIFDREGRSRDTVLSYGLFILGGLVIGGRLVHCLAYEPEYYLKYPWDIIKPWRGVLGQNARFVGYRGMSGHGSAAGIVLGILLNSIRTRTSMVWMVDRIALFGPLIGFFVRIGNLFNSEILGKPSGLPWAFLFVRADPHPRHPVQLYESIAYLMIFLVSYRYYLKKAGREKPGEFLGLVLTLVYSARFVLEFFKAKQSDVETSMQLNMGHLLSIPLILVGLFLLLRPVKPKKPDPQNDIPAS
jgi:phosphatidylglycerol:prolipoprotein diacylglycerol transferase